VDRTRGPHHKLRQARKEEDRTKAYGSTSPDVPIPSVDLAINMSFFERHLWLGIPGAIEETRKWRFDNEYRNAILCKEGGYLVDAWSEGCVTG